MRRRIVPYLLIVSVLVQGIAAAHSHGGVSRHDPSGLYRPPHFHLRFAMQWLQVYHDRVEPSATQGGGGVRAPDADHDADAIYLPDADGYQRVRPVMIVSPPVAPTFSLPPVLARSGSPSDFRSATDERGKPIYLLFASLLI
jgi:hypothetical protein